VSNIVIRLLVKLGLKDGILFRNIDTGSEKCTTKAIEEKIEKEHATM